MAVPISLATTLGISVDFCSSGYLDVSVHRVRSASLCIQLAVTWSPKPGSPIQRSSDQSSFTSSPRLFAGIHVFRRLFPPRHPPYALIRLTISNTSRCPETGIKFLGTIIRSNQRFAPIPYPRPCSSFADARSCRYAILMHMHCTTAYPCALH